MKIKSIILTTKGMYAVSNDIDTIFNKMNESYFFADTLISKDEESDLQHLVRSEYRHVEKVNAKLVIE